MTLDIVEVYAALRRDHPARPLPRDLEEWMILEVVRLRDEVQAERAAARVYAHSCPDCDDGTYEVCSDPEPFVPQRTYEQGVEEGERRAQEAFRADIERYGSQLEAAHDRGVAEERAAVVAWLRAEAAGVSDTRSDLRWNIRGLSNCIERGEHRREEKP